VTADQRFAPITRAREISSDIRPALSAVKKITVAPVLVWITTVIARPMNTNHRKGRWLNWSSDTEDRRASTLSFIKSSHKKMNPKPTIIFEICCNLDGHIINKRDPIPIIGRANASIWKLNHRIAITHGVSVVPILAPITTPNAFITPNTPAPTKPSVIIVATVLLCSTMVCMIPTNMLLKRLLVDFLRILRRECVLNDRIVSSKRIIQKRKIPSPHISPA